MNKLGMLKKNSKNIPHIYCADHILHSTARLAHEDNTLNSFVEDNSAEDKTEVMKRLRELIMLFSKSDLKTDQVKSIQPTSTVYTQDTPDSLLVDVVTRCVVVNSQSCLQSHPLETSTWDHGHSRKPQSISQPE
jgi:hypothetical protein